MKSKVLKSNLQQMSEENQPSALKLDDQIDCNMRETLVIHGVPGTENSWENNRIKLSIFLADLSEQKLTSDIIYNSIIRSHRDGKDNQAIFVKLNSNFMVDEIKSLRLKKHSVFINQMRSPLVTARIKKGLDIRKNLKNNEGKKK